MQQDSSIVARLQDLERNVVLQESYPENDDGSLSWAALKWGVRYVNIETRLGWLSMQKKMLKYANENLP